VIHLLASEQRRWLLAGKLDLGLLDGPRGDGSLVAEPLFDGEPLRLFVFVHDPLSLRDPVAPRLLAEHVLVTPPRSADPEHHDTLLDKLDRAGYRFRAVRETRGHDVRDVLFAVAQGWGVTVGPRSMNRAAGEVGGLVTGLELDPPQAMPKTVLAWRPGTAADAGDEDDLVHEVVRSLQ
jgi:DNA-binding transcriptional LysR family regulator